MKINFVSTSHEGMASYRYHNMIPAYQLSKLGHTCNLSKRPVENQDIYIFSKHHEYKDQKHIQEVSGTKVFHCCDSHFDTKHNEHYRHMIKHADLVICTTRLMADIVKQETGVDAVVVPDTFEFPIDEPRFDYHGGKLKVLWYGHLSNINGLSKIVDQITHHNLKICTHATNESHVKIHPIHYIEYSHPSLKMAFEWCDVVIVPVNMENGRRLVKSHNRVTEAVISGKFVIASPIESYKEYDKWMYIGDVVKGLEWLTHQGPTEITKRIRQAQSHAINSYNPERIGKLWATALDLI